MSSMAIDIEDATRQLRQGRELRLAGCQISPLVLRIRNDGPAVLDGEYVHDNTMLLLERHPVRRTPANRRKLNAMIISVILLSISLVCVCTYAWQQKHQVSQLEAELLLLEAAERE